MPLSGFLAATYGWPFIFYTAGCGNLICGIAWLWYGAESPAAHKTISNKEKNYIQESLGQTEDNKPVKIFEHSSIKFIPKYFLNIPHYEMICTD